MPRPALEFEQTTRELVAALAALGMSHDIIASLVTAKGSTKIGIAPKSLRKYFPEELTGAGARLEGNLVARMTSHALYGTGHASVDACKYLLDRRFGWNQNARQQGQGEEDAEGGKADTPDELPSDDIEVAKLFNAVMMRAQLPAPKDEGQGEEGPVDG